ncbi:MAG: VWA containing CoxE family protein [Proteobacteria bacterium]|nr:VWA containing CoxE family protein [Pseudomonadota bacterium]
MSLLAFFYILRKNDIPVTTKEWFDFYNLLKSHQINNLDEFYYKGRSVLVKSEKLYDAYDKSYIEFTTSNIDITERLTEILDFFDNDTFPNLNEFLTDETLEEIIKRFNERFENQKEKHTGGGRHIGQKGYSPFGNSGAKRDGIRLGGSSTHNNAFYVATERKFKNLREDVNIDERNIALALKKLRHFQHIGIEEEVSLDETIDATAKNFGDIEIIFKRNRINNIKLLLFIDNGGSMEPYRERVEKLFSIAKNLRYFKDFKHFYFHNCIYDNLYTDTELWKSIPTYKVLQEFDGDWKVIIIGDALMSPYELYNSFQFIYRLERTGTTGIEWLNTLNKHFRKAIWLNPISQVQWQHQTVKAIKNIFPMFPLTVEGLEEGIKVLLKN